MTSTSQPTREELMQLALLEAYGLLDEYEEAEFGRMFRDASAAEQDDIRELQAEVASDLAMLPDLDPPAELKARVLARVATAVESEASTLAPLAKIGRVARAAASADERDRLRSMRAATFWRAACFVLCAALIVSLYFQTTTYRESNRIVELALGKVTTDQLDALGPGAIEFLIDQNAAHVVLVDQRSGNDARANGFVSFREERRDAFLHISGLSQSETYVLRVEAADGIMRTVREFDGLIAQGVRVELTEFTLAPKPQWRIEDSAGKSLLEGRA